MKLSLADTAETLGGVSYVCGTGDVPLHFRTVGGVLADAAARWPEREALVVRSQGVRLNYGELLRESDRLANGLLAAGLRPGDRVGIWAPNRVEWIFTQFATARASKGQHQMVLAMINTIFAQKTLEAAIAQWRAVADQLRAKFPKRSILMDRSEADVLAFMSFPKAHTKEIHSTNPLGRLNAEIKRRTDVVGIFQNEAAITRLVEADLLEQSDEWALQRRYMQLECLQTLTDNQPARLSAVARRARVQPNRNSQTRTPPLGARSMPDMRSVQKGSALPRSD